MFAAAVALQGRPVRVHVRRDDSSDAGLVENRPSSSHRIADDGRRSGSNMKGKVGRSSFDGDWIKKVVEDAIRSTDVEFTPAGKNLTIRVIRSFIMINRDDQGLVFFNGEPMEEEDYINKKVEEYSKTSGIFDNQQYC